MKDSTLAARMERAVAQFQAQLISMEALLGRLERVSATLSAGGAPLPTLLSPAQPPIDDDPEAQKLAEEYMERRKEELIEERLALDSGDG